MSAESGDHNTLKHKVYADLRQAIIMGRRQPGDKIDVRQIARHYGTSITPVREAMQMLNQEGLIVIKPHSGFRVTRLTLKQLKDLLDLREILEVAAVERAASRITEAQLAELEASYSG